MIQVLLLVGAAFAGLPLCGLAVDLPFIRTPGWQESDTENAFTTPCTLSTVKGIVAATVCGSRVSKLEFTAVYSDISHPELGLFYSTNPLADAYRAFEALVEAYSTSGWTVVGVFFPADHLGFAKPPYAARKLRLGDESWRIDLICFPHPDLPPSQDNMTLCKVSITDSTDPAPCTEGIPVP